MPKHIDFTQMGKKARVAQRLLAMVNATDRDNALRVAAASIRAAMIDIIKANAVDLELAKLANMSSALIDRLTIDEARVMTIATSLDDIAALPDPFSRSQSWLRPNGLKIERRFVPIGVIGIIYESRPNVTADAAALCIKSGNAVILRGGSDASHSSRAIYKAFMADMGKYNIPMDAVQLTSTDRAIVGEMLAATGVLDLIIPRGGQLLVERVEREARVPVLAHLHGNNHTYVDGSADVMMAKSLVINSKLRRVGICGATETVLFDEDFSDIKLIVTALIEAGCEIRATPDIQKLDERIVAATDKDWDTEYLDAIVAVKKVKGVMGAIAHIAQHGSGHTEAVVATDVKVIDSFVAMVDSAIVMVNASTQFADGGQMGLGAEIGIATGRIHARGPVGADQLTTTKYIVHGHGQIRPV